MDFLSFDVIVIGSGAAGFNVANRIKEDEKLLVAIVTEAVNCGTSRNTGSDKQTYYKLNIGGDTRGSALYYNKKGDLRQGLEEVFRFTAESGESVKKVQETFYENGAVVCKWRSVRPIPESNDFFENVWKRYREDGNIY